MAGPIVVVADEGNKKMIDNQKKVLEKKRLAARSATEALAATFKDVTVTISRKVGEKDKLFGSVSSSDIVEALKKAGHKVEKRMIQLESPLKALGVHNVSVNFDSDITAPIKVWIVKDES